MSDEGNGTSVLRSVRLNADLAEWFDKHFPWRGSLPGFLNDALASLREEIGDREPTDEIVARAIRRLGSKYEAL
jgi:hypothetical protein